MKPKDAQDHYFFYSGKASDIVRQMALAGIAVVWLFQTDVPNQGPVIPRSLLIAAIWLIGTLALDFLQYLFGAVMWGAFHRLWERKLQTTDERLEERLAPRWINWPTLAFFWLKIPAVVVAYWLLLSFLAQKINAT